MQRRRNSRKVVREIKELRQRLAQLEAKYLDLYGQLIVLKNEVDEALMEGAHYALAEKKLKRMVR